MNRFHSKVGMAPQIAVPTNISDEIRIALRRPRESAINPQMTEPTAVPVNAVIASQLAVCRVMLYSSAIPGMTKPSVAGFMMSTMSATTRTTNSVPCARVSGALSALTSDMADPSSPRARLDAACRGIKPYTDRMSPATMRNMPAIMTPSTGMSTILKPKGAAIMNMGMCAQTPAPSMRVPVQKAIG